MLTRILNPLFCPALYPSSAEGTPFVKVEPNEDSDSVYMSSHQGTPAPYAESVAETVDSKDPSAAAPEEEEKKDFKFEEKVDLKEDFDLGVRFLPPFFFF